MERSRIQGTTRSSGELRGFQQLLQRVEVSLPLPLSSLSSLKTAYSVPLPFSIDASTLDT